MAQRDNRLSIWVIGMHHPAAGATRRCPVQSSTPLGPDQVNVLLLLVQNHQGRTAFEDPIGRQNE
jgi:hypothetical protein